MKKFSRREFIKLTTLGTAGAILQQFLTACGLQPVSSTPMAPPTIAIPPTNTPFNPDISSGATAPEIAPAATTGPIPDLAVVHGGDPEAMVRRALDSFGGIQAFVNSGAKVVIKPNICVAYNTYEYASTTNPWVVGALVKMCLEAGASRVSVFDFPFGGTAENAYQRSGIREQVEAAGGQMEIMSSLKYTQVEIPNAQVLKKTQAYMDALEADVLINVPIAKHHGSTRLSLGMKNLMGLVLDRNKLHTIGLGKSIADLAGLFRPELTVVDAVRILTANGPTGGNLADVQQRDTIIVSPDFVAADAYATGLFGLKPNDISYIKAGAEAGIGRSDLENLRIDMVELGA